ncbi:hypothetical protein SAY87_024677 [Trapa incisa]|uniref:Bet v I/Major latex protein domain-containing protein n=1 Tax=Trapa incisa TaxID=236973 RepID=A0AAN7GPL5_9MYRT|nr:hypothetical protein SAY87_024677 [Trapa incisa]
MMSSSFFLQAGVPAGSKSMNYSLEKITKLDHDNRVKELDVVEGGLLDMGFTLYRYRIQVFEKGAAACTIKFTVEYELPDELAATNASLVSNEILVALSDLVKDHLLSLHAGGATIN